MKPRSSTRFIIAQPLQKWQDVKQWRYFFRCQSMILCLKKRKEKKNKQNKTNRTVSLVVSTFRSSSHHITRHMIEERLQELQHELHAFQYDHNQCVWYTDGGEKKKKKNQTARVGIIRHTNQDRFEDSWEITKDRMTQSVWMHSTADSADSAGHY